MPITPSDNHWSDFLDHARSLDASDPLAAFRSRFTLPTGLTYLDGNSLGPLSANARESLARVVEEWATLGIRGWTEGRPPWFTFAEELGSRMGRLMGAPAGSVIATGSTTVNLHQFLATLYHPSRERSQILMDSLAFPSDRYAVVSHLALRGQPADRLTIVQAGSDGLLLEEELESRMNFRCAMVVVPSVVYTTGQLLDVRRLCDAAHRCGALIGVDCSHSAGAVPHQLFAWDVDFAFWCGYKYLNGGPGSSAFLYLHPRYHHKSPGLAGWFGSCKERQFEMADEFTAAEGAGGLQIGTPNLLSMAPLWGSLTDIQDAGINTIRAKSLAATDLMMLMLDKAADSQGITIATPREHSRRGGHVAVRHTEAMRICKALSARGIVPDFRPPDTIRLAPAALYNTFSEAASAVVALNDILTTGEFERVSRKLPLVT